MAVGVPGVMMGWEVEGRCGLMQWRAVGEGGPPGPGGFVPAAAGGGPPPSSAPSAPPASPEKESLVGPVERGSGPVFLSETRVS